MAAARAPSAGLLLCALVAPVAAALAEGEVAALSPSRAGVVLQRVPAPDTDTIRWAVSRPSIMGMADLGGDARLVRLDRFGRKVDFELRTALPRAGGLVLDLRSNRGGSLRRMLRVAARFAGPVPDALALVGTEGVRKLPIPIPEGAVWRGPITVLVGADTMSSGEVLAALLRRYAGATVLGERTFGKDYVLRVEPIGQEWRALVPDARIEVPDEELAGGLLPDGPIPTAWVARIAAH